jgi:hypothetical protein
MAGEELGELAQEVDGRLRFARRAQNRWVRKGVALLGQLIGELRGDRPTLDACDEVLDSTFDSDAMTPFLRTMYRLIADYVSGDFASAAAHATRAARFAWIGAARRAGADYQYYAALAFAAHHDSATVGERPELLRRLRAHLEAHRAWQAGCPDTFLTRFELLEAELARIEGRVDDAMQLYERAAIAARQNGFVHSEAIACECASRFYRARGLGMVGDMYVQRARDCYLRWGADAKVEQLERLHPFLTEPGAPTSARFMVKAEQLDLLSVVKASQTISCEVVLDKLLHTLLRVLVEQGGAQQGTLALQRGSGLFIDAHAVVEGVAAHLKA